MEDACIRTVATDYLSGRCIWNSKTYPAAGRDSAEPGQLGTPFRTALVPEHPR